MSVGASSEAAPKPKRGKIGIAIAVLGLVACIGGATFALGPDRMLAMVGLGSEDDAEGVADAEDHGDGVAADDAQGVDDGNVGLIPFDEIIVNITSITATGRRTSRFLKVTIAVAVNPDAEGVERIVERKTFIRDAMQDFLRQLHEDDLAGSAGVALLKSELLRRVRVVAETEAPREVLLADLVIQ